MPLRSASKPHRPSDKLGFDLPPGTVARGEEREILATELEGRICKAGGPAKDRTLHVGRISLPCGARVRVRETHILTPFAASFGRNP